MPYLRRPSPHNSSWHRLQSVWPPGCSIRTGEVWWACTCSRCKRAPSLRQHHMWQSRHQAASINLTPSRSRLPHAIACLPRRTPQQMATAIRPLFTSTAHPPRFICLLAHCHTLFFTPQRIAVFVILAPLESWPALLPFSSYSCFSD
jgi:hypothetical protein